MIAEKDEKLTQDGTPQISTNKRPIEDGAYYTIAEITDRRSPWYIASQSTIFRALRSGALVPYYLGGDSKRVLFSGAAIHNFIRGGQPS